MNLSECRILELAKIKHKEGNLTFIEGNRHIPFEIKRVFYIYDVPRGEVRGAHAHRTLQQFIIAANGSFDVILDDGFEKRRFVLNRPNFGLYIPPLIWQDLKEFSPNSVCLVLASDLYKEDDYIRDYETFKAVLNERKGN